MNQYKKQALELFLHGRQELKTLNPSLVMAIMFQQARQIFLHSVLPALISTVSVFLGHEPLLIMWLGVIVTAYLMHKQEMKNETDQGLCSAISWVKFASLFGIFAACSLGMYPAMSSDRPPKVGLLPFVYLWVPLHIKACENVALYRMYLRFFGAVVVSTKRLTFPNQTKDR